MNTITHNGVTYPFRLSYKALKSSLRATGLELAELDQMKLEHIAIFAVESINNGFKKEGKDDKVTLDQVEDWLDDDFGLLTQINDAISYDMKVLIEPNEAGGDNTGK